MLFYFVSLETLATSARSERGVNEGWTRGTKSNALFATLDPFVVDVPILYPVKTPENLKTNISYPLLRTRMCAYQGVRNVSF